MKYFYTSISPEANGEYFKIFKERKYKPKIIDSKRSSIGTKVIKCYQHTKYEILFPWELLEKYTKNELQSSKMIKGTFNIGCDK